MGLSNPIFQANARIRDASHNSPPMTRGETDQDAVKILQRALISVGAASMNQSFQNGNPDGHFGQETIEAVRRFQTRHGQVDRLGHASGNAGRAFWEAMDAEAPADLGVPPLPPGAQRPETPGTTRAPVRPRMPTPAQMEEIYRSYRDLPRGRRGKPCARNITNQCGVRMSVALMRANIGFHYQGPHFAHNSMLHNTPQTCGLDILHTPDLFGLMNQMADFWQCQDFNLRPGRRGSVTLDHVRQHIDGRPGIILFRYMTPLGNDVGVGQHTRRHIDYWDGRWIMNDRLNYNAANELAADSTRDRYRYHRRSWLIRFIALGGH